MGSHDDTNCYLPSEVEIAVVAAELRQKHFAEKRKNPPPKPSRREPKRVSAGNYRRELKSE